MVEGERFLGETCRLSILYKNLDLSETHNFVVQMVRDIFEVTWAMPSF